MRGVNVEADRDVKARYLLGQLSEEEMVAFEERYFADDTLYQEVLSAETDLLDEYFRGELSGSERQAFERLLGNSPHLRSRSATAVLLDEGLRSVERPEKRSGRWKTVLAAAAAVVLVAAGSWLALQTFELRRDLSGLETQRRQLEADNARLSQQISDLRASRRLEEPAPATPAGETASITLVPGLLRGGSPTNDFAVARDAGAVLIEIPVRPGDAGICRVRVETVEGSLVLDQQAIPSVRQGRASKIVIAMTPGDLPPGDYILKVSRQKPGSAPVEAGAFAFRITYR